MFRKVDITKPTLLWDEVDTLFGSSRRDDTRDIQGFLNAGFERGAKFTRCVGQNANLTVQDFEPFCPKALSGIGKILPDTTADRCISIELLRQSREEKVERFRKRDAEARVATLRAELEAWSRQQGLIDTLRAARPFSPEELTDRQQDICEPLLAIAELAGGGWPNDARHALVKLCVEEEDDSRGVKLLAAFKHIFDSIGADRLSTKDALDALVNLGDDAPWPLIWQDDLKQDNVQKAATKLARMLKCYKIKPHKIRIGEETVQGYYWSDFEEAWKRYLSATQDGTSGTVEQSPPPPSGPYVFHYRPDDRDVPSYPDPVGTGNGDCEKERCSDVPAVP